MQEINFKNRMIAIVILAIFFQGCIPFLSAKQTQGKNSPEARVEEIKLSYRENLRILSQGGEKGQPLGLDDLRAPDLFNSAWRLVGEWIVIYLNSHSNVSPDGIISNLKVLNESLSSLQNFWDERYELDGNAILLAPETYAVAAGYPSTGTFFVVSKNDGGKFQVVWDIKKVAGEHYAKGDELGRWAFLSGNCYGNGPLVGWVHSLPKSKNNNPRFYVSATTTGQGGTIPGQLSVWEWDDAEAHPLWINSYFYYIDGRPIEFDGQFLKIYTKGDFKTFFSCGMCPEPEILWTIHITPDGVEDLSRKDVVPELRMVDELFYRLFKGLKADDIASHQVILKLMPFVKAIKKDAKEPYDYFLSMLGGWENIKRNGKNFLYFKADNLGCNKLSFEIKQTKNGPYFVHLKVVDFCR